MKKFILYIAFLIPVTCHAQSLSIEEFWGKLAQTNPIRQSELEIRVASKNLEIEKLNRLPLIYADVNLQRNIITPTTPVPAIAFNPSAQDGAIIPLKFATNWNSKAGVQVEWKFFDPNRKTNLEQKQILVGKSEYQKKLKDQDIKKQATLAYTSIILASLQYKAAVEDSILYHQIVQTVDNRYQAGRESSEQYSSALQEFERKKIQIYDTWAVLKEADYEIQKYVELNDIKSLSSSIDDIKNAVKDFKNINYDVNLNELDTRLNEVDKKAIKRQLLPSFTFNAYYGTQYFDNSLKLFSGDNWFGNSYANIAMRLPISSHFVQTTTLSKISSEKEVNQIKSNETNKLNEIQRLKQIQKVNAAKLKVTTLQKIVKLSEENLNKQKLEFQAGKILLSDMNKSISKHISNRKELWQAEYDLISTYLEQL